MYSTKKKIVTAAASVGLAFALAATALAAEGGAGPTISRGSADPDAEVELIDRRGERLQRAIENHRVDELSARYRDLHGKAEALDAAPKANPLGGRGEPEIAELRKAIDELRERIGEARRAASDPAPAPAADGASGGPVAGVSQGTLESIAACESGGDPNAVNAAGYYGKYQFDAGTWQSVGGSGNPAQASEAEQDRRAAMLYARAGASPWPNCGT